MDGLDIVRLQIWDSERTTVVTEIEISSLQATNYPTDADTPCRYLRCRSRLSRSSFRRLEAATVVGQRTRTSQRPGEWKDSSSAGTLMRTLNCSFSLILIFQRLSFRGDSRFQKPLRASFGVLKQPERCVSFQLSGHPRNSAGTVQLIKTTIFRTVQRLLGRAAPQIYSGAQFSVKSSRSSNTVVDSAASQVSTETA